MNILIITKSDDHEGVQLTIDAIKKNGGVPVRFNTDCFPTEVRLDMSYGLEGERLILITPELEIDLREIDSVYYRRAAYGDKIPLTMDSQYRNACLQESKLTIEGLLTSLRAYHVDPLWNVRRASVKQFQLQLAQSLGLMIPKTLITNNPKTVKEFYGFCSGLMITKMQASFAIYQEGVESVVFTSKVKEEDLEDLDGLALSPMMFQELVPKKLEFRVTIVGNQIFSSAIDSQKYEKTRIDWRRDGIGLIDKWEPVDLPKDIEEKLFALMDKLQLQYGAIDLLQRPDGSFVFLEVNPAGEYFWLDRQRERTISNTLAELLMGKHRRRV
ncbi:MAG: MvdD family ATP-grasp ribosomal peptide maturase [Firmicutes bacterium]|nr:MvdD family ATP-grasp ribosomal peptide maturase [Bacillota bacterium]